MDNKVKLITPLLMLFAGALASVIMYVKKYEFFTMLWVLLVVLVVFYIIGDVVRYIYAAIRPRVITARDEDELELDDIGSVIEKEDNMENEAAEEEEEAAQQQDEEEYMEEEYSEEGLVDETEEDRMPEEDMPDESEEIV